MSRDKPGAISNILGSQAMVVQRTVPCRTDCEYRLLILIQLKERDFWISGPKGGLSKGRDLELKMTGLCPHVMIRIDDKTIHVVVASASGSMLNGKIWKDRLCISRTLYKFI